MSFSILTTLIDRNVTLDIIRLPYQVQQALSQRRLKKEIIEILTRLEIEPASSQQLIELYRRGEKILIDELRSAHSIETLSDDDLLIHDGLMRKNQPCVRLDKGVPVLVMSQYVKEADGEMYVTATTSISTTGVKILVYAPEKKGKHPLEGKMIG